MFFFHFFFHNIWDVILPIDFHIFQDGYCTTNQYRFVPLCTPKLGVDRCFLGSHAMLGRDVGDYQSEDFEDMLLEMQSDDLVGLLGRS